MSIGNHLMHKRVGTYNFSRKVLKPKIFSSRENHFYTVHRLSKIMAYFLLLMLNYFLSACLVIFVFDAVTAYSKNQVMPYLSSIIISVMLPLWHFYYLGRVMSKQILVLKNYQLSNFVIRT